MTTPGRHLGVFPECAAHWDWMAEKIINGKQKTKGEIQVLNLFGYTGLASLACAASGAKVTHVDASKKSVSWAHANQVLSGLAEKPVRWIVDDALKFVEREARRGIKYDGILLDPPKFGRGPKGEVWEVYKSLPQLLRACRAGVECPAPIRGANDVRRQTAGHSRLHCTGRDDERLRREPGMRRIGDRGKERR